MPPNDQSPRRSNSMQAQNMLMTLFTTARLLRPSGLQRFAHGDPPAPRHVIALFHLATKGPMSVSDLAASLGVTLTTASLSVTQMAASGLVVRNEDPNDHRRTIVSVSKLVQPVVDEALTTKLVQLKRALAALGEERSESLLRDLKFVHDFIESEIDLQPPPQTEGPGAEPGTK